MDSPFFSVVIPTCNRADFIVQAARSVLRQEWEDWEVIIIDDGSTDDTEQFILRHFAADGRVRYVKQENKERGAARNHGLSLAKGQYSVFFDSDDYMHPNHLKVLKQTIDRIPDANFLAAKYDFIRNGKKNPSSLHGVKEGWYDMNFFLNGNPLACHFCVKNRPSQLQLFHEDRQYAAMEDWMFLLQNLQHDRIYIIDQVTVSMNDHSGRSMRNNQPIIQKRLLASRWVDAHINLSDEQRRLLDGYSYYFCAIHSYLDHQRTQALRYLLRCFKRLGARLIILVLLLKIIAGKKSIDGIRKFFR